MDFKSTVQKAKEADQLMSMYADELDKLPFDTLDDQEDAYTRIQYYLLLTRLHKGAEKIADLQGEGKQPTKYIRIYDEIDKEIDKVKEKMK